MRSDYGLASFWRSRRLADGLQGVKVRRGLLLSMLAGTHPWRAIIAGVLAVAAGSSAFAGDAADVEFFEKNVRPVLVEQCFDCHSAAANKTKGGLQVDSRPKLLAGGDTGPAILPRVVKDILMSPKLS